MVYLQPSCDRGSPCARANCSLRALYCLQGNELASIYILWTLIDGRPHIFTGPIVHAPNLHAGLVGQLTCSGYRQPAAVLSIDHGGWASLTMHAEEFLIGNANTHAPRGTEV